VLPADKQLETLMEWLTACARQIPRLTDLTPAQQQANAAAQNAAVLVVSESHGQIRTSQESFVTIASTSGKGLWAN